ncbi:MAG: PQQ-binding-like beta-propeller repeat protein [Verrucomicrobia bacterium]|nr:PQQ-binding-like beta-propeller repeat protein [Verrucomicrobiota bacterium]
MKKTFLLSALCSLLCPWATNAHWPQFRGPDFNGTDNAGELPAQLSASGGIAWQTALPGRGLSSPIILKDRVYVTCSSGPKQQTLHVLCLSATDGHKIWERTFQATGRTMCHEKTSVAAPSPATDGERVFALFSSNDLVCLDLDGNLVWFRGLSVDYPNASNSLGMSSSLATADGALIAQVENDTESFTAGIDVATGANLWKLDRPRMANWCSPTVLSLPGGKHLAALQSGKGITAVDPRTGRTAWDYKDGASTTASSALSGSVIYAPSHGLTALDFSGDGEPKQLWRAAQLRPGTASPVIAGGRILLMADGGVLTCGELETGKRLWQLRTKGPFSGTPVAAGNRLLAVNEKGLAQLVDLSKPEGEVISELDLNHTVLSTPSLAKEGIYIRGESRLWKLRR